MHLVQTQQSITVHCPSCGHFKSRHIPGAGCEVCAFMIAKKWGFAAPAHVCRETFKSRLSQRERDQARAVSKDSYGGQTKCATCYEIWWAHDGLICPNGETLFVALIGEPGKGA
jgi:hypothetical protein